jgi:hypothetical protein
VTPRTLMALLTHGRGDGAHPSDEQRPDAVAGQHVDAPVERPVDARAARPVDASGEPRRGDEAAADAHPPWRVLLLGPGVGIVHFPDAAKVLVKLLWQFAFVVMAVLAAVTVAVVCAVVVVRAIAPGADVNVHVGNALDVVTTPRGGLGVGGGAALVIAMVVRRRTRKR